MIPGHKFLSLLWPFGSIIQSPLGANPSGVVLKHRHAFVASPQLPQSFAASTSSKPPHILFNDVLNPPDANDQLLREQDVDYTAAGVVPLSLKTTRGNVKRPRDAQAYQEARRRSYYDQQTTILEWGDDEIPMPDLTDRSTVLELAKIAGNAYSRPDSKNWYSIDNRWNASFPFGWEESENGFRGNIFADDSNSTVVISIKGTSLYGSGNTATRDKLNDNRLFSCCCAHVSRSWAFSTVCDCFSGGWACTQSCLEKSLQDDDLFYNIGINLFNNVTYLYPNSDIWIVGHSLGGGLSGLIGATFGAPTVTFEALGDRLPASRLHLPTPPPPPSLLQSGTWNPEEAFSLHPITHIYHTGDPVPHGTCTGVASLCAKGGYALESRCHLGKTIVYDTVTKFKWSQRLVHHPIAVIINKVLAEDWEEGQPVPEAAPQLHCRDCHKWEFMDDE